MNTSDQGGVSAFPSALLVGTTPPTTPTTQGAALSSLTTALSLSLSTPSASPSEVHDPEVTIMVVVGLAALLAGVAAFLAVCRPSGRGGAGRDSEGGDSEGGGGGGFFFCRSRGGLGDSDRGRAATSEPQLKVWKRLGSYRRSYNRSFRRPPPPPQHRRPPEAQSPEAGPGVGGGDGGGGGGGGCGGGGSGQDPPHHRRSPAGQTPLQPESCRAEPHAAMPCLFDYVTEI